MQQSLKKPHKKCNKCTMNAIPKPLGIRYVDLALKLINTSVCLSVCLCLSIYIMKN